MNDTVNVDIKLGINKYHVDEGNPHIIIQEPSDTKALQQLILACPASLYKPQDNGTVQFDYAGCLECGTCRVLGRDLIFEKWDYPQGTFGIEYRYG